MAGVESAGAIISLIKDCIEISKTIIEIGRAVNDAKGLTPELQKVFEQIPNIKDLLKSAQDNEEGGRITKDAGEAAKTPLQLCEKALDELHDLVQSVCKTDLDKLSRRIWKGTKAVFLPKGSKMKQLLETIYENLRFLDSKNIMTIGDKLDGLKEVIEDLSKETTDTYNAGRDIHMTSDNATSSVFNAPNAFQMTGGTYHNGPANWTKINTQSNHNYYGDSPACDDNKIMQGLRAKAGNYKMHRDRNPQHVPGTCEWFFNHEKYTSWRDNEQSTFLLVTADPGCGKSVLAKAIVSANLPTSSTGIVCYFFFKDDSDEQRSGNSAICAILHQLFSQGVRLPEIARTEYRQNPEALFEDTAILWDIFVEAMKHGKVLCVFDALDECDAAHLSLLFKYASQSVIAGARARFLVTSRPSTHVKDNFWDHTNDRTAIHLDGEEHSDNIKDEIDLVIEDKLNRLIKKRNLDVEDPTIKDLRSQIQQVEHRTYLWIKLMFEFVEEGQITDSDITFALQEIPKSIYEAYEAILSKSRNEKQTIRLLQIICAARYPLTVEELGSAMAFQGDNQVLVSLNKYLSYKKDVIKNIGGCLVSVIQNKVYLLHQTTKEFLLERSPTAGIWSGSIELQEANYILAKACMKYLTLCSSTPAMTKFYGSSSKRDWASLYAIKLLCKEEGYVFSSYASSNWYRHLKLTGKRVTADSITATIALCDPKTNVFSMWYALTSYLPQNLHNDLHVMVFLDVLHIVRPIINTRVTPNAVNRLDRDGLALLHYAVKYKSIQSVLFLLTSGADINLATKNHSQRTPLLFACQQKDSSILQILLDNGASKESNDAFGQSALELACSAKSLANARILLRYGAIQRILDNSLYYVCYCIRDVYDMLELVSLLLQSGANVNARVEDVPLIHGACNSVEVLRVLLKHGADIHARSYSGSQAIHAACQQGNLQSLKLLLQNGADIHASTIGGLQAIHEACIYKYAEIVDFLLAYGANVHALTVDGRRPIHLACGSTPYRSNAVYAQKEDTNADTIDEEIYEPVHVTQGSKDVMTIIKNLIRYGADVNASDKDGQQPLDLLLARKSMNSEMVKLLIKHGASAGMSNIMAVQPVRPSGADRQPRIMKLSAEKGAHVQMEDNPKTWDVYNKFLTGPLIIPIIGSKGSGKENLIRLMGAVTAGKPATQAFAEYTLYSSGQKIVLVDTPELGDAVVQNAKTLQLLAKWLSMHYYLGGKIARMVYVYPMTDDETYPSTADHFRLFESMVGEKAMRMVTIVTTMWDDRGTERDREACLNQMKRKIWLDATRNGASFERGDNTVKQMSDLLKRIVKQSRFDILTGQKELVFDDLSLFNTTVGREIISYARVTSNSVGDMSFDPQESFGACIFEHILTVTNLAEEVDAMIRYVLSIRHWNLPEMRLASTSAHHPRFKTIIDNELMRLTNPKHYFRCRSDLEREVCELWGLFAPLCDVDDSPRTQHLSSSSHAYKQHIQAIRNICANLASYGTKEPRQLRILLECRIIAQSILFNIKGLLDCMQWDIQVIGSVYSCLIARRELEPGPAGSEWVRDLKVDSSGKQSLLQLPGHQAKLKGLAILDDNSGSNQAGCGLLVEWNQPTLLHNTVQTIRRRPGKGTGMLVDEFNGLNNENQRIHQQANHFIETLKQVYRICISQAFKQVPDLNLVSQASCI